MTTPRVYYKVGTEVYHSEPTANIAAIQLREPIEQVLLLSDHKEVVKSHQELNRKLANHNADYKDLIERLKYFTKHEDTCPIVGGYEHCACGLAAILQEAK